MTGKYQTPDKNRYRLRRYAARRMPDYDILAAMTTPTDITLNDISDLVRILRERPEWQEAVRHVVISNELLSVPQQLAEFVRSTNEFIQVHQRIHPGYQREFPRGL